MQKHLVALIALVFLFYAGPSQALNLVTGDDYQPFTHSTLPDGGLTTHLIQKIAEEMNADLDITILPWARGFLETKRGKFDGTYPYIRTQERMEEFLYSDPLYMVPNMVFVRHDRLKSLTNMQELVGLSMCKPTGYAVSSALEPLLAQEAIRVEPASDLATCFRMLNAERVDFLEIGSHVGQAAIRRAGLKPQNFKELPITKTTQGHFLIVSKQHPDGEALLNSFNSALDRLKVSGRLMTVIRNYMNRYPEE